MSEYATDYLKPELMACCGAREIHDGDLVLVGTGFPSMAAGVACLTHAPRARLMQESGVYDARPKRPALSVGDPCLNPGAAMIGGLADIMGMFLQGEHVDVGFLSGSQVDRFGNINTTAIGDYERPRSRLPGSGGANPIGALCKRTIIISLHDTRRLAAEVDFLTTPGYLDGGDARQRHGMAPGSGPCALVTNKAVLRFDDETHDAYLATVHPGCTIDEVLKNTPWDLKVADDVHETEPPTNDEMRAMRVLDPNRMIAVYVARGYV